ncbi:MAG TPA: hypothetical protein VIM69_00315, partial [Opitutaceae bacterium]
RGRDPRDRLRSAQELAEEFLPGINILDTSLSAEGNSVQSMELKAYFTRAGRPIDSDWLRFPYPASWLPEVSTSGTRHRSYITSRRRETLALKLNLPSGWKAAKTPEPFSVHCSGGDFNASWKYIASALEADLAWSPSKSELSADEYPAFRQSVRALKVWLDEPVSFTQTNTPSGEEEKKSVDLVDFPILPTGDGQLRLLEEKYPEGEKNEERRTALKKVIQWFPQDVDSTFTAKGQLLLLDEDKIGESAFAEQFHQLIKKAPAALSPSLRAWGEYLEASAQWKAKKDPAATKALQKIAANESLQGYRRSWAAYKAAEELASTSPEKALAFVEKYLALRGEAQPNLIAQAIKLQTQTATSAFFEIWLQQLAPQIQEEPDNVLSSALKDLPDEWADLSAVQRARSALAIARVFADAKTFPKTSVEASTLRDSLVQLQARTEFCNTMRTYFNAHPPAWYHPTVESKQTAAEIETQIKEANKAANADRTLNAITQFWFTKEDVSYHSFVLYTSWALQWMDGRTADETLTHLIATETLKLPPQVDGETLEIWFYFGRQLVDGSKFDEAESWFKRMLDCPAVENYQRVQAHGEIGLIRVQQGRVDDALAEFDALEPIHTELKKGVDYVYVSTVLRLQRGQYTRALQSIESIRKQDAELIEKAKYTILIKNLLRAAENHERVTAYWKRSENWWPKWISVMNLAHLNPPK